MPWFTIYLIMYAICIFIYRLVICFNIYMYICLYALLTVLNYNACLAFNVHVVNKERETPGAYHSIVESIKSENNGEVELFLSSFELNKDIPTFRQPGFTRESER